MSSETICRYLIVDVFPLVEGSHFEKYVGAVVGCWVRIEADRPLAEAQQSVARDLFTEGWGFGRLIEAQIVSDATYGANGDGVEHFRRSAATGFAAHVHLRRREAIRLDDGDEPASVCASSK